MFVTLLGRPGAGKTTLGYGLETAIDLPYISGSQLLRRFVAERQSGWEQVDENLSSRTMNPPELQIRVLKTSLAAVGGEGGILDGFPKTVELVEQVDLELPLRIDLAIYLEIPAEVAEFRIAHRLVCNGCGFPESDRDAAIDDPCPRHGCDGHLVRRHDDRLGPERRLDELQQSLALRDYYAGQGKLAVLAGVKLPNQLVVDALNEITLLTGRHP